VKSGDRGGDGIDSSLPTQRRGESYLGISVSLTQSYSSQIFTPDRRKKLYRQIVPTNFSSDARSDTAGTSLTILFLLQIIKFTT
jgi:hypothetical protein